jgi:site-specific recombinase XerD
VADQLLADWLAVFPEAGREAANAAVAKNTRRTYKMHFQRFLCFILTRQQTFESCSLDDIFDFLLAYSRAAPKFSLVSSASPAIKWFLKKSSKADLAKDPRLATFLKGMKPLCHPPKPKYHVWNPCRVLDWIAAAPKPVDLITAGGEAAVLLLLATGSRLSDILRLRARFEKTNYGVRLFLFEPRKTDLRKQFVGHLDVGYFPENRRICPARALLCYLRLAFPLRQTAVNCCFISSTGHPASQQTVERWIEDQLKQSGVVTSAGSLCSASTSAAFLSGVDVDAILKSVGWKREETWRRHYLRPILEPNVLSRAYAPRM